MTCETCADHMRTAIARRSIQPRPIPQNLAPTPQKLEFDFGSFVGGIVVGFIIGGFLLTSTGRSIGYESGQRVARGIRQW